ncbi:hypothetical protein EDD15DRAFT_2193091 [Pisolithus albus]|nr:hypothetical protein EDD15DRAFT_2193091 [Pisolithus albus]
MHAIPKDSIICTNPVLYDKPDNDPSHLPVNLQDLPLLNNEGFEINAYNEAGYHVPRYSPSAIDTCGALLDLRHIYELYQGTEDAYGHVQNDIPYTLYPLAFTHDLGNSYVPSVTHGHLIGGWPLAWKTFYEKAALDYVLLPDEVRNTLDNLTPEGRVAVDSAFFEGELSECEDTKGNQPSDGTSLLHYLHKFLNHQLANEYYKTVTKYAVLGKQPNHLWCLPQALLPMGSTWKEKSKLQAHPVPAHDIVKTGSGAFEFVDYLQDTELLSHAINRALQGGGEPEVPSSERREIIFNQKPGPHADR